MTNEKRPADVEPGSKEAVERDVEADHDTEGHSVLNAQLGGVMANERARDAAKWARQEQARKQ